MADKFVFVYVPVQTMLYPSAAYGVLKPVLTRNSLESELCDLNIMLSQELTSEEFENLYNWSAFAKEDIDVELKKKVVDIADSKLYNFRGWLAFSVFSFYNARIVNLLLNHIKDRQRDYKILLGGNGCTASLSEFDNKEFGQYCLDNQLCDYVIFGEGEVALDHLLKGDDSYPGINKNNFHQVTNLDTLDFPDYKGIDWSNYVDPRLMITGSRGCVRKCTFCDVGLTWPKFRYRSAENIVEEIKKNFYETGITQFEFTDSLINGSTSNFKSQRPCSC